MRLGARHKKGVTVSQSASNGRDVKRRPETKSFILTSEFWVTAGAAAAVFLAGYALEDIAETTAWRYGTWIAIAYIISRGIAKAGSQRAYQPDPTAPARAQEFRRDDDYRDGPDSRIESTSSMPAGRDRDPGGSFESRGYQSGDR
jgi:hypothetical protein